MSGLIMDPEDWNRQYGIMPEDAPRCPTCNTIMVANGNQWCCYACCSIDEENSNECSGLFKNFVTLPREVPEKTPTMWQRFIRLFKPLTIDWENETMENTKTKF